MDAWSVGGHDLILVVRPGSRLVEYPQRILSAALSFGPVD